MIEQIVTDSPIERLHRFYGALDERRYEAMVQLMADDAVWLRQGKVLQGAVQVLAALGERAPRLRVRHVMTNAFGDVSGAEAVVTAYQTVYRCTQSAGTDAPDSIPGPNALSVVTARMRRDDQRGWVIVHLASKREFVFGE